MYIITTTDPADLVGADEWSDELSDVEVVTNKATALKRLRERSKHTNMNLYAFQLVPIGFEKGKL